MERHQRDDRKVLLQLGQLGLAADERDRTNRSHGVRNLRCSSPLLHGDGEGTDSKW
jgi:hypothetical protein